MSNKPPAPHRLFHGGVPGLRRHQPILPANTVNPRAATAFAYDPAAHYNPNKVYVTTHLGTATAFASRYIDIRTGQQQPGTVYEVEAIGSLEPDPDYPTQSEAFYMARKARVLHVVQTGVILDRTEQLKHSWPHLLWTGGAPMYTETGQIIPSPQHEANGVSNDYLALLPPWTDVYKNIDAAGELRIPHPTNPQLRRPLSALELLNLIDALDHPDHTITVRHRRHRWPWKPAREIFVCACGKELLNPPDAARHQLGEHAYPLVAQHNTHARHLPSMIKAAYQRNPQRWQWLHADAV